MCMCVCLCLSVCQPSRPLITSGAILCDVGRVWLVKPILQLFNLLLSMNWMGVALVTQHVVHARQRYWSWHHTNHERRSTNYLAAATGRSALVIKMSGQIRSNEFERQLGFSFTVIVLAQNNFLPLLKSFINKTLKYKVDLNLII